MALPEELKSFLKGDVATDEATLTKYSRDASLFEIRPQAVVFPRDAKDIGALVSFVSKEKKRGRDISLTPRSAGTDMTGGSIGESIVLDFTKYMNRVGEVSAEGGGTAEPGAYYRDFEKATLEKGLLFPSYPASKELCAIGGIVANNSGGEKSLIYGKTDDYIHSLKVVLADGKEYTVRKLSKKELEKKIAGKGFEAQAYRKTLRLLDKNYDLIKRSKPRVSKNSSGYNTWDVWDKKSFDLPRLFVGSQGTLGIITEATLGLVKTKPYAGVLVMFERDLAPLANIINLVLPFKPTSFESFDDHTLRLALRFLPGFLELLGSKNLVSLGLQFLPEFWMVATGGFPKLVLLAEFEGESQSEVDAKLDALERQVRALGVKTRIARTQEESKKYWAIRRESFNLLRHHVLGKQTAPFIDDLVVLPEYLPEFLPKLYEILDRHEFMYTIAGHVGDGNFHIIPLMNLAEESEREKIPRAAEEVYDLVLRYHGSLSAEHNDGLVRGPYLKKMYGEKIFGIFKEIKAIFDPLGILNPKKKTEAELSYALSHIKRS